MSIQSDVTHDRLQYTWHWKVVTFRSILWYKTRHSLQHVNEIANNTVCIQNKTTTHQIYMRRITWPVRIKWILPIYLETPTPICQFTMQLNLWSHLWQFSATFYCTCASGITIICAPLPGKHSLRALVHLWTSNASSNRRFGPRPRGCRWLVTPLSCAKTVICELQV